MNQAVNDWIDAHKQELLDDIKELCAIPSVKGSPEEGKPFGDGPYRALQLALSMADRYGFAITNYDNYVGTADFDPDLPRYLDVLAHTDVVPAGEGWTVTEPFHVIEKDNRLYGRGTSDDKGPLLCSMYAMRAIRETGIPLSKGVRLIMGADEECGASDTAYYYSLEPEAEITFSPDGEFPIINIEKGLFRGSFSCSFPEDGTTPRLLSLDAGLALNAVPQKAVLRFEGLDTDSESVKNAMESVMADCRVECLITGEQEITVNGVSAHASTPEEGRNAGLAAVILACRLPLHESEQVGFLKKIPQLFPYGATDGSGIGICMSDPESHDLTCTLDLYHVDTESMSFGFDSRTPICANKENCQDVAEKMITDAGFVFATDGMIPPHVVPADSYLVRSLLESFENVTGLKGKCLAVGGGTYVHWLKSGVAYGPLMEGTDTHMHGADEFFDINDIMTATKIYAEAILNLCR